MASGAFFTGHDLGDFFLYPFTAGLPEAALQVGNKTFKLIVIRTGTKPTFALHFNTFFTGTVQQRMQGLFAEIFDGRVQCKAVPLAKRQIGHLRNRTFCIIPTAGFDGTFPN